MRLKLPPLNVKRSPDGKQGVLFKSNSTTKSFDKSATLSNRPSTTGQQQRRSQFQKTIKNELESLLLNKLYKKISEMKIASDNLYKSHQNFNINRTKEFLKLIYDLIMEIGEISEKIINNNEFFEKSKTLKTVIQQGCTKEEICDIIDKICGSLNDFKEKILLKDSKNSNKSENITETSKTNVQ